MGRLRFIILTGCHLLLCLSGETQSWPAGGRAAGMAYAALCNIDVFALFNGPAAIGYLSRSTVGLFYDNRFLLPELSTAGLSGAFVSRRLGVFSAGFTRFGSRTFSRSRASFCYARTFSPFVSAAMVFNYHHLAFSEFYGQVHAFTGELSLMTRPIKPLTLAFHLVNPIRQRIASFDRERLPALLRFGLAYQWSEKLRSNLDLEKDLERPFAARLGLELIPHPMLYVRGGAATGPVLAAFGMGLRWGPVRLDVASTYHQALGFSPQASLGAEFGPDHHPEKRKPGIGK
ncbi:MAG: hypothetical protein N2110_07730 [Flavobacteriales bacterium]|nr:hypothetical protein [Flavobacteriales bacterium]MCX7768895.1 hypothetical protein [Flavobacteriales bacterium]MDW8410021.1 hypothetical protein [Flavobacteriales bacterium]